MICRRLDARTVVFLADDHETEIARFVLPEGGVTMVEMDAFCEHLRREVDLVDDGLAHGERRYPVTPRWQRQIRDRLKRLGMSQVGMARRLGISTGSMSNTLSQPARWSRHVRRIEAYVARHEAERAKVRR